MRFCLIASCSNAAGRRSVSRRAPPCAPGACSVLTGLERALVSSTPDQVRGRLLPEYALARWRALEAVSRIWNGISFSGRLRTGLRWTRIIQRHPVNLAGQRAQSSVYHKAVAIRHFYRRKIIEDGGSVSAAAHGDRPEINSQSRCVTCSTSRTVE